MIKKISSDIKKYPIIVDNNNYFFGRNFANLIADCVKRVTDDEKLSDKIIEEINKEISEIKTITYDELRKRQHDGIIIQSSRV